jgi:serine/threonine-protein kinase
LPADEPNPELPAPSHKVVDVGRYRLIAELARGGMGIVYLALVRGPGGFNKLFVVKVLKEHMSEDPKLVFMFLEEARLAAKLNHPNVVQTIEVGSDRGQHFIAMEYLDGQSLHRILARGRRTNVVFPRHFHLYVIMELLEGLQYAHGVTDFDGAPMRLVHRDVSPQNVLVTYDGLVKILDFGIAKALDSSNDTRTGMLKGKVAYMAPEQASGEPLDGRADVFAVGAMLWEAAVGDRMWRRTSNDLQILHALMNGAIPRPREANPDIDPRLERMILKATAYRPADRHASAAELQAELGAYIRDSGHPPFGARDIGKFVCDVFTEERAQIKTIIEGQLRLLRTLTSGEHAKVDLPLLSPLNGTGGTPSGVLQLGARVSGETAIVDSYSAAISIPPGTPVMGSIGGTPQVSSPPPARSGATGLVIGLLVALIAVIAVAGGVAVLMLRRTPAVVVPAQVAVPAQVEPSTAAGAPLEAPQTATAASGAPAPSMDAPSPPSAEAATASPTTAPPQRPTVSWRPTYRPSPEPPAAPTAPPPPPPASAAPAPPPTVTAHVRQQIDTSNPYSP